MKNNRFLLVLMAGGLLSACSTTPAPSIYKGGPSAVKPAPDVDANAPVVRPLTQGAFKETPLEAKPLPAKPLNSYAPSAAAPSVPMAPTVNYAQQSATAVAASANAGVSNAANGLTNGVNDQVALASTSVNSATAKSAASINSNANSYTSQANQVATASASKVLAPVDSAITSIALPVVPLTASPAARELSASADAAMARGDLTASAASLERALRIEPNNAGLWSRLSEVRLRQGDNAQAEQLALKSNGLAAGNAALRTRNDKIVAAARAQ
jgi:hypothetical protein